MIAVYAVLTAAIFAVLRRRTPTPMPVPASHGGQCEERDVIYRHNSLDAATISKPYVGRPAGAEAELSSSSVGQGQLGPAAGGDQGSVHGIELQESAAAPALPRAAASSSSARPVGKAAASPAPSRVLVKEGTPVPPRAAPAGPVTPRASAAGSSRAVALQQGAAAAARRYSSASRRPSGAHEEEDWINGGV